MNICRFISILSSLILCFTVLACEKSEGAENSGSENYETPSDSTSMKITINGMEFEAAMAKTEAAKEFYELLPMNLSMSELNGNEKYCYLNGKSFTTSSERPGTFYAGDIMLYGSNCVVIFYETFRSSYSYTRIARIENASGLAEALGSGGVEVAFGK